MLQKGTAMSDIAEFKRMNFFTGFFTTADDWKTEQDYHRLKLKMHNCGVHTPGIMRGIAEELRVIADASGNVLVQPGTAIDSDGNEIYLGVSKAVPITALSESGTVYVTLAYGEKETDPVTNVKIPEYSGNTRWTETPIIKISADVPDNCKILELARIVLTASITSVSNPSDPASPGIGEIDRRYVVFAGSIGAVDSAQWLDSGLQTRVSDVSMPAARKAFAALSARFPTPSAADVRQGALTIQMMACSGSIRRNHLASLLDALADTERDAGQEIGVTYAELAKFREYQDYVDAVAALRMVLKTVPYQPDTWLISQDKVSLAAGELAQVVIAIPIAVAGNAQTITTLSNEAQVTLDASASHAFGGRDIVTYQWGLQDAAPLPQANPGADQSVLALGVEAAISLDASASTPSQGEKIEKYTWDLKNIIIPL
jgi:hypothetical protein